MPTSENSLKKGYVPLNTIPTIERGTAVSKVLIKFNGDELHISKLNLSKETSFYGVKELSILLTDAPLVLPPLDRTIVWKLVLNRVKSKLKDKIIIYDSNNYRGEIYLSPEGAQNLLKNRLLNIFIKNGLRDKLNEVAQRRSNMPPYPGLHCEYPVEWLRDFAFELAAESLTTSPAESQNAAEVHEEAHVASISLFGAVSLKLEMIWMLLKNDYHDSEKTVSELEFEAKHGDLRIEERILGEAISIIHELFQSRVIGDLDHAKNFSVSLLCSRLLTLFALMLKQEHQGQSNRSIFEKELQFIIGNKKYQSTEHDMAILILLFGPKLVKLDSSFLFDFSELLAETKKLKHSNRNVSREKMVAGLIIDRVCQILEDPQKFAEELLSSDVLALLKEKLRLKLLERALFLQKTKKEKQRLIPKNIQTFDEDIAEVISSLEAHAPKSVRLAPERF